ncbi:RagB/SusD family nutrient uptake outer membrane protein [Echinicola strongylocentroti]|uniref:RagB/SusD family nutrient uptake outer membrane protein n=1 Tax=Echinicola strongylocentroti TaxID=1795355 RepID=A0A2Z4IFZ2_9BACT|nr:RagB/SusD family nutrient uptake outer membrane protein [Echinicola strongylocentroti]AWW29607.1 RagB/SusD family nutrient uptake outer membrane protein [Echinicola strongylocentroti]
MNIYTKRIVSAIILAMTLFSCSDLEETPYSFLTINEYYNTAEDAESAITAAYGALTKPGMYGQSIWMLGDYSADQMFPKPVVGRNLLTEFTYDATHDQVEQFWNESYNGINNVNLVIQNVPLIDMDEARREEIVAEAKFLRGLFYFNLVKTFGEVPLKVLPTASLADIESPKNPSSEIYAQIIQDLKEAGDILNPGIPEVSGRASQGAAQGLLAKVYLYNGQYAEARDMAKTVMDDGTYRLVDSPGELWDVSRENANRVENIFAVEFSRSPNLQSQNFTSYLAPAGSNGVYAATAWGSSFAFEQFYHSYADGDLRKQLMDTSFVDSQGVLHTMDNDPNLKERVIIAKYADPMANGARNETNFPILRYADILLIYAEASARASGQVQGEGLQMVNAVRDRAGLGPLPSAITLEEYLAAIMQERSWELAFEADRWFDMTRTGEFLEIGEVTNYWFPTRPVQPKHRFFPIPENEVLTNANLDQNEPWK